MVQEQSRKYELQGSKTRGGQPIILGARGNAVTSGRGAVRDDGAEQWQRGGGHLRNFGGRTKVHILVHGHEPAVPGFHHFPHGFQGFPLGFQGFPLGFQGFPLRKET